MRYSKYGTTILDGNLSIACDPLNPDYQDILRRIRDEGLVIEPYVPPPPPPVDVTAKYRQRAIAKLARAEAVLASDAEAVAEFDKQLAEMAVDRRTP